MGKTVISKSRWQTDEFPINLEFFREMGRQGFDAESFSGVMTSEQKVDAQFFGGDRSPVRRFAGNESVDSFRGDAFDLTARCTGNDADSPDRFLSPMRRFSPDRPPPFPSA